MKLLVGLAILAFSGVLLGASADTCDAMANIKTLSNDVSFNNLNNKCSNEVVHQIKREIRASYKYFQMGAYFASEQVNLPGFSELFFNAAKEERDHSAILMNYLAMRMSSDGDVEAIGKLTFDDNLHMDLSTKIDSYTGADALKEAHNMEKSITGHIKKIIQTCDSVSGIDGVSADDKEYHVSDFLTGDFLTEQYNSERSFAGKYATLKKMSEQYGSLAEFMFDKTL